jgi:hypothetical protein
MQDMFPLISLYLGTPAIVECRSFEKFEKSAMTMFCGSPMLMQCKPNDQAQSKRNSRKSNRCVCLPKTRAKESTREEDVPTEKRFFDRGEFTVGFIAMQFVVRQAKVMGAAMRETEGAPNVKAQPANVEQRELEERMRQ